MKKLIAWIKSWFAKKVPVLPTPIPIPTPLPTPEPIVCGCKDGARIWPLQHMGTPSQVDKILAAGGYECGGTPQDIRIQLCKPSGGPWVFRHYFGNGVKSLGNGNFTGLCFDNPHGEGRYHFIGWSKSDLEKDMIKAKSGDSIHYDGTMFFYWELRAK